MKYYPYIALPHRHKKNFPVKIIMASSPDEFCFSVDQTRILTGMDMYSTAELFTLFETAADEKRSLSRSAFNSCFRQMMKRKYSTERPDVVAVKVGF
jgi:hypothetical protein